jgi:hypothetical protein
MRRRLSTFFLTQALCLSTLASGAQMPVSANSNPAKVLPPGVLDRVQAAAILPQTVYFRGQTASIQGRNSSGIKLPDGRLVLFALVDTAGYASAIQQTYQAYLITEEAVTIGDQTLAAGAYGFGFLADNRMVVMDIGGKEVLHTLTTKDTALGRPNPLQVLADPATSRFRLYLGRSYVTVGPAAD